MLAAVSRLPALTVARRVTRSGDRFSCPVSATWLVTSDWTLAERGTISTEPALISMRGGIVLTDRRSASFMPMRRAASAALMVTGALQAVQLAYWPSE